MANKDLLLQFFEVNDTLLFVHNQNKRIRWAAKILKKDKSSIRLNFFPIFTNSGYNHIREDDFEIPQWDMSNSNFQMGFGHKWILIKISEKDYQTYFKRFNKITILDALERLGTPPKLL